MASPRNSEDSNELCLFCIDTQSDIIDDRVMTLDFNSYPDIACKCKVKTHVDCWMKYILHKGHIECPICHKIFQDQDAILRLQAQTQVQAQTNQNQNSQIQIIYTQQAYPQYLNPMIQVNSSQNQNPVIIMPPQEHAYRPFECIRRRSRNNGCILLAIVLAICIFIIINRF